MHIIKKILFFCITICSQIATCHATTDSEKLRILLVDDSKLVRIVALKTLKKSAFDLNIDTAEDGNLAVEKVTDTTTPYDLILMDINMPNRDGVQATIAIRNRLSAQKTKIIRHSTETNENIIAMAPDTYKNTILSLFDGQLPKPFRGKDIEMLIERLFPQAKKRALL